MPFNFSSAEYLSHHRTRKNRVSPVNRASPAHMNSPLDSGFDTQFLLNVKSYSTLCRKSNVRLLRAPLSCPRTGNSNDPKGVKWDGLGNGIP